MPLARPEPAPSANVPIRPVIIHKPIERIIEREYIEGYQGENAPQKHTGPIQRFVLPPVEQRPERPIIVNVASPTPSGERTYVSPVLPRHKKERDEPGPRTQHDPAAPDPVRQPPMVAPTPEQKEFAEPNKKSSPERIETIPNNSPVRIDPELFTPDKPAPQASGDDFKKVGKVVGRQRSYDDMGENDIEPVREVFLLRHLTGKHWPGLSKDMENYYEHYYFTKPKKGEKYHARHVKCWERRTKWIAAHTA